MWWQGRMPFELCEETSEAEAVVQRAMHMLEMAGPWPDMVRQPPQLHAVHHHDPMAMAPPALLPLMLATDAYQCLLADAIQPRLSGGRQAG